MNTQWNKYEVATAVALAELDTATAPFKMTAQAQKEIFGYNVFGRQSVMFTTTNNGCIDLYRGAAFGTDTAWTQLTFTELAEKLNAKMKVSV